MIACGFSRPSRLDHGDRRLEAGDVDIVGVGIDVDEHRLGLGQRHHLGGRRKGEARHEHRVARSDARWPYSGSSSASVPLAQADDMLDADIGGELVFELGDLGPEDILAAVDDAVDRRIEPVAEPLALRAKIDELHVCPRHS